MSKPSPLAMDEVWDQLAESLLNGNRSDVAQRLSEYSNPAWALLRVGRSLVAMGEHPLDVIVNLQALVEDRWENA